MTDRPAPTARDVARQAGGCGEIIDADAWADGDAVPSTAGLCDNAAVHRGHAPTARERIAEALDEHVGTLSGALGQPSFFDCSCGWSDGQVLKSRGSVTGSTQRWRIHRADALLAPGRPVAVIVADVVREIADYPNRNLLWLHDVADSIEREGIR